VVALVKDGRLYAYRGTPDQQDKPELIHGHAAALYTPQPGDVIITPREARQRGWIDPGKRAFKLEGKEGAAKLLPLLRRLGSIYNRGAKCTIDYLELDELELPEGGTLRIQLNNASPGSLRALGELFEVLDSAVEQGEQTGVYLDINEPDDDCAFIQELKKA
jgi:hypothetical protein